MVSGEGSAELLGPASRRHPQRSHSGGAQYAAGAESKRATGRAEGELAGDRRNPAIAWKAEHGSSESLPGIGFDLGTESGSLGSLGPGDGGTRSGEDSYGLGTGTAVAKAGPGSTNGREDAPPASDPSEFLGTEGVGALPSRAAALRCLRVLERCLFMPPAVARPQDPIGYAYGATTEGETADGWGGAVSGAGPAGRWQSACHDPQELYQGRRSFMEGWAGATRSRAALRERVAELERELARVKASYRARMSRRVRQLFRVSAQHALLQKRRQDTMTQAMLAPKAKLRSQFASMGVMQQQQTLGALMRVLRGGVRAVPVLKLVLALPRSQRLVLFHGIGCWLRVGDKAFRAALRADFDSTREMRERSKLLDEAKTRARSESQGDRDGNAGDGSDPAGAAADTIPNDSSGEAALREKEEVAIMNIEYLMQLAQGTGTGRLDRIKQEAATGASGMEEAAIGLRQLVAAKYRPAASDPEPTHGGGLDKYTQEARDFASSTGGGAASKVAGKVDRAALAVEDATPQAAQQVFDLGHGPSATAAAEGIPTTGRGVAGSGLVSKRKQASGPYARQTRRGSIDVLGILKAGTTTGDKIRQAPTGGMPFVLRGLMLLDAAEPLVDEARAVSGEMALRVKLADVLEADDHSRLAWAHTQLSEHRDFLKAMELSRMAGEYDRKQIRGKLRLRPPAVSKEEIGRVLEMAGEAEAAHGLLGGGRASAGGRRSAGGREAKTRVELDTVEDSLTGAQGARARALLQVKQKLRNIEANLRESDQRKQRRLLGAAAQAEEADEHAIVERRDYLSDSSIVRDVIKVCADAGALRHDLQEERERRRGLERRVLALGMRLAALKSTLNTQTRVAREQGLLDMSSLRKGRQTLVGRMPNSPGFTDGAGFVGLVLALQQRAENWGLRGGRLAHAGRSGPSSARQRELQELYDSSDQIHRRSHAVVRAWVRSFRGGGRNGASAIGASMRSLVGGAAAFLRAAALGRLPLIGASGFSMQHYAMAACSLPLVSLAPQYPLSTRGRTPSRSAAKSRGFDFKSPASSGPASSRASGAPDLDNPNGGLSIESMHGTAAASIHWSTHFEGERVQKHESRRAAIAATQRLVAPTEQLVARAAVEEAAQLQPSILAPQTPQSTNVAKPVKVVWSDQKAGGAPSTGTGGAAAAAPSGQRIGRRRIQAAEASPLLQRLRRKRAELSGERMLADADARGESVSSSFYAAGRRKVAKGGALARLAIKHGASEELGKASPSLDAAPSSEKEEADSMYECLGEWTRKHGMGSGSRGWIAGVPPPMPYEQSREGAKGFAQLHQIVSQHPLTLTDAFSSSVGYVQPGWLGVASLTVLVDPTGLLDAVRRGAVARAIERGRVDKTRARGLTQKQGLAGQLMDASGGGQAGYTRREARNAKAKQAVGAPATAARRGSIVRSILKHHEIQAERSKTSKGRRGSVEAGGHAAVAAYIGRRGSLSLLPEIDRVAGTALEELLAVVPKLTAVEATVYRRAATGAAIRRLDRTIAWQAARRNAARARMDALGGDGTVPAAVAECIADVLRRSAFQAAQDGIDALTALDAFRYSSSRPAASPTSSTRRGEGTRRGRSKGRSTSSPPKVPSPSSSTEGELQARAEARTQALMSEVRMSRRRVHPAVAGTGIARLILQAYLEMPYDAVASAQLQASDQEVLSANNMTSAVQATEMPGTAAPGSVLSGMQVLRADAIPSLLAPPLLQERSIRPATSSSSPRHPGSDKKGAHGDDDSATMRTIETAALQHCVPSIRLDEQQSTGTKAGRGKSRGKGKRKAASGAPNVPSFGSRDGFLVPQLQRAIQIALCFYHESTVEAAGVLSWCDIGGLVRHSRTAVLACLSQQPNMIAWRLRVQNTPIWSVQSSRGPSSHVPDKPAHSEGKLGYGERRPGRAAIDPVEYSLASPVEGQEETVSRDSGSKQVRLAPSKGGSSEGSSVGSPKDVFELAASSVVIALGNSATLDETGPTAGDGPEPRTASSSSRSTKVLTLLETHSIALDLIGWLLDNGGIESLLEQVSAKLYASGCRNEPMRSSLRGAVDVGHRAAMQQGKAHGSNDWVPTFHSSVGRFVLRVFLAQQAERREEAEQVSLHREYQVKGKRAKAAGAEGDSGKRDVAATQARLQSIAAAARRASAGAFSMGSSAESGTAGDGDDDLPDARSPTGRAAMARLVLGIDARIEAQASAFEAAVVLHSSLSSRCRCFGVLLGLTDVPSIGVSPAARQYCRERRLEVGAETARRGMLLATQSLPWPCPLDYDPEVLGHSVGDGDGGGASDSDVARQASEVAMDVLRATSDWRQLFLEDNVDVTDDGGTSGGAASARPRKPGGGRSAPRSRIDSTRFHACDAAYQLALWERYSCLLALAVDTALDSERGSISSYVLSSSAARFYLGRRVGLGCQGYFNMSASRAAACGGKSSRSGKKDSVHAGRAAASGAVGWTGGPVKLCTIAGAPAGAIVYVHDSLNSRGVPIIRPGCKQLWVPDVLAAATQVRLGSEQAVTCQRLLEEQLLGRLVAPAITPPNQSAASGYLGYTSSVGGIGAATGISHASTIGGDSAPPSGAGGSAVSLCSFGPIVDGFVRLYCTERFTDVQSADLDASKSIAPLLPGSALASGLLQLQAGWTMLTADRVRSMCYRSLSQGLDPREAERYYATMLASVLGETMHRRAGEQEYLREAARRSAEFRSSDFSSESTSQEHGQAVVVDSLCAPTALDASIARESERIAAIDLVVARLEPHLQSGHAGLFSVDDAVELAFNVSQVFWVLHPVGTSGSGESDLDM